MGVTQIDPSTGLVDASTMFMMHGRPPRRADAERRDHAAPKGVNEAKGFVFISHIGDVFPSGFLPLKAGNMKQQSIVDIYRTTDIFRSCATRRT
jgi:MoaA/NifB/PqqE/SkfB family radical SAM enzyme